MQSPDDISYLDPKTVDDPYPFYAALREHAPVYRVPGTEVYLVSKRALIEDALEREQDFSANLTGVLMTGAAGELQLFDLSSFGGTVDAIANADEPSHAVHRKLVLPYVTPTAIAALEETFREWTIELIDPLLRDGGGDWVARVANPLPTRAMARMIGLPMKDVDRLVDWAMTGTEILAGTTTPDRMTHVVTKAAAMAEYLATHLALSAGSANAEPSRDVLGAMVQGIAEGLISENDAVSILVVLVGAGGESTSSLTGNAVRLLAEREDLQHALRTAPTLVPDFIEEVLRLESPFRGHYRHVNRETTLGNVDLPKNSRILLLWAAANRAPETYEDPDAVDLCRPGLRDHLAFGRGMHFCVGARLARLEARVILEELLARTRAFTLDPESPPEYVSSIFVRRHRTLRLIAQTP